MAIPLNFNFSRLFLVLILLASSIFGLHAQDTLTLERLDYKFVTLEEGRMSPVSSLGATDVAGTFLPCEEGLFVEFCSPNEFSIWVDGRFVSESKNPGDCVHLSGDELCGFSPRDTVFVSLVSEHGLLGVSARTFDIVKNPEKTIFPKKRGLNEGLWRMGFVVCGALLILARMFLPNSFGRISKPTGSTSEKFFTIGNILQLLLACVLGAFLWSFVKNSDFVDFITVIGTVLFWWVSKTILTITSGALFRFRIQANWQTNFLLQFWTIMFALLFALVLLDELFINQELFTENRFRIVLALLEALFVLTVFIIFRLQKGIKSLHRFVYLCTTEILPGVLIIQFFLE